MPNRESAEDHVRRTKHGVIAGFSVSPRCLDPDCDWHSALADLTVTMTPAEAVDEIAAAVLVDVRQQRDNARGQDQLFGPVGVREAQWARANPGLAALLQAVDDAG